MDAVTLLRKFESAVHKNEDGTYVSVKLDPVSYELIYNLLEGSGIDNLIPKTDLHATIYHSRTKLDGLVIDPNKTFESHVIGFDILGKPDGQFRALVMYIQSETLIEFHNELNSTQPESSFHKFPSYLPHISIKYKTETENEDSLNQDLEKLKLCINPGLKLILVNPFIKD